MQLGLGKTSPSCRNKETSAPLGSEGPHQAGEMYHATRDREDLAKLQV